MYTDASRTVLSPAVMVSDFDPNIHVDNTKEGYATPGASPLKGAKSRENLSQPSTPAQDDGAAVTPARRSLALAPAAEQDNEANLPIR